MSFFSKENRILRLIWKGNVEEIRNIFGEIKWKDDTQKSGLEAKAILTAAECGQVPILRYLFEEVNLGSTIKSKIATKALKLSTVFAHIRVVKYLVKEAKANIEARDGSGYNALLNTIESNGPRNSQMEIVQFLCEAKAKINARTDYGHTALILASRRSKLNVVQYLLENYYAKDGGCGVNSHAQEFLGQRADGHTALYFAIRNKHLNVVKHLLRFSADPNVVENMAIHNEVPLLVLAAGASTVEIVRELIDAKANINTQILKNRETALHAAAEAGNYLTAKCLIEFRALVDVKNKNGATPQDLAEKCHNTRIETLLKDEHLRLLRETLVLDMPTLHMLHKNVLVAAGVSDEMMLEEEFDPGNMFSDSDDGM
mmetsp:Transcript_10705/g.14882  ORF Transcript_10705/g.14882 Transcript_10705/m.14882 type:complete len:372 (-) Transcript_10705:113-1228(-)|eukprot:jgi/Bigna1/90727/estExt_fgenesh1_pg.C_770111